MAEYCFISVVVCVFVWGHIITIASCQPLPILLTTWNYTDAVINGWETLTLRSGTPVDAVEATGHYCEMHQCRLTVGFGGSPDEKGETTLDAMIMDGGTLNVGGVGGLRRIKQAISVARKVLENTDHSLLVGDQAVQFAVEMGFKEENLTTDYSRQLWETWKSGNCQPNFRENVNPDPRQSCGPYTPAGGKFGNQIGKSQVREIGNDNHDTIGIIAIDKNGNIASGTSTNGLKFKVPGRVGDSPIAGAGSYADSDIGAAACTGNGDIMMRFLPSYHTVSLMASGASPEEAATIAIDTIVKKYPDFKGAVVAVNKQGKYGASCHIWTDFQMTVRNQDLGAVTVYNVTCH